MRRCVCVLQHHELAGDRALPQRHGGHDHAAHAAPRHRPLQPDGQLGQSSAAARPTVQAQLIAAASVPCSLHAILSNFGTMSG